MCEINVFALVNSNTFYTWNLEILAGNQPENWHSVENAPDKIVIRLAEPFYISKRNISFVNYHAS